jgi:signal transduction histidine kinase
VDSCFGGFAYGAAAGIDLTAGATCLAIASQRRPRDDRLLYFAALAILATGAMVLLYSIEAGSEGSSTGDLDRAFAVSTLCAFVPLAWYVGVSWSHQKDDEHLSVAGFHLLVAALFALNRFDALVASGTIDMVFLQPFAFPIAVTGAGLTRGARKLASARCDTTRRRAAATSRSALRGLQVQQASERAAAAERDRIARELHDSVSQTLYSIAMVADALPVILDHDPATAGRQATQIRSMTLQALGDLRVLLLELRQSTLESASLAGLLEQMSADAGAVQVVIEGDRDRELPPPVKLAVYRIIQQAVTNARRHAGPATVVVHLRQRAGGLTVSVVDDGVGFDTTVSTPGRHGLQIMRERAAGIGADLRIRSRPGRGTQLRLTWPAPGLPQARTGER